MNRGPAIATALGSWGPGRTASARFVGPAMAPLTAASHVASVSATLRVRLLSSPQHRHAATIASAGHGDPKSAPAGTDRTIAPATIAIIQRTTRRSTFSRNTNHARTPVNTAYAVRPRATPDARLTTDEHREGQKCAIK